ncbi:MAG: HAD family hydrolase [Tractidigestivibacter sp.]|jgi:Cof subfamily protein (haloacid dehalogenase superfamily)|uniref:HAD family hydrolase n=1 Tax=Tractidigestivibacter sp. TaxID=2847320 RepID=UPI003D91E28C
MIKLVASDMDGTLLDENSELPEETFDLIHQMHEQGIVFVASSGRRYGTLRWFFEPVADEMDYVGSLGCQVYAEGKLLDREVFSTLAIQKLFRTCSAFDCLHLVLYDQEHTYLLDDLSHYVRELDKDLPNAQRMYDPPSPGISIIKAAVCYDRASDIMDMVYVLERELGEWFTFMPSGSKWIDVTPRGVNKATGVAQLMRYYGITPDEVIAFGDSMNDYSILRFVGHPYVMGNARYALKQIAENVIGTNEEHAVQQEMRRILADQG